MLRFFRRFWERLHRPRPNPVEHAADQQATENETRNVAEDTNQFSSISNEVENLVRRPSNESLSFRNILDYLRGVTTRTNIRIIVYTEQPRDATDLQHQARHEVTDALSTTIIINDAIEHGLGLGSVAAFNASNLRVRYRQTPRGITLYVTARTLDHTHSGHEGATSLH